MIPTFAFPGEMIPGQFGPISRVFFVFKKWNTFTMSSAGIPSDTQTTSPIPADADSMIASAANAGGTNLCSDDVLRLFIDWLDSYHEAHFAVIREIYRSPGVTRLAIWSSIRGELPREDSAEADLFKMLIRDLSLGGVIRQVRATTPDGQFLRQPRSRSKGSSRRTMESAFEDSKPYVLTELGSQFVHYTMTEIVPRIGSSEDETSENG